MRLNRYLTVAVATAALVGCTDLGLEVENPNNPDRERVLANAADVESLAGAQFQQIISGTIGNIERVNTGMMTASFENASGLANNGLGPRSLLPRIPIDNSRGNSYAADNFATFRILSGVARNAADVLARAGAPTFSLGTGRDGDVTRLKAWAHFISGVANGYLAMTYDSAAIARPTDAPADIPALTSYTEVATFAVAELDSAFAYASQANMTNLPAGWLTGPAGVTVAPARFREVIRAYRAKVRAGVARTPQERGAVNWGAVIADATNGLSSDLVIAMNRNQAWDYQWLQSGLHYRDVNWHQMTYYIIGMADVSGAYDAWLAAPRETRTPFLIITPDLRFPQGADRAAQNLDRGGQGVPTGRRYFRNRLAGLDAALVGWQVSYYDHYRFLAYANANGVSDLPFFTRAENDMLAAEGYIRTGNIGAAAALIDRTRTTAGLPGLSGVVTTRDQPVPGGASCVPRVPTGPTTPGTRCGDILEAMKWEKRMETAYTTFGAWYFDSRGWGDLPEGTAVHWPVPFQELDARQLAIYNTGGVGQPGGAGASTYGFGSGTR